MVQPFNLNIEPITDAEHEAAVNYYLDKLKQMLQDMNKDRREFDRNHDEINATLADIMQSFPAVEHR